MAISERAPRVDRASAGAPGGLGPRLEVQDVVSGGWHTLRLCGEVDLPTRDLLNDVIEQVCRVPIDGIVLDLSEVSFIDSSGIHAVLELTSRCEGQGTELRIIPGPSAVQHVFEVTGLLDRLPFLAEDANG